MSEEQLFPAGWHNGHVVESAIIEAKTGTSQVLVKIQDDDDSSFEITAYLSMTEASIKWTVKKLRGCGFKAFSFAALDDSHLLAGNKVRYEVEHKPDQDGKMRAQVGWINDPDESQYETSEKAIANAVRFDEILKSTPPKEKIGGPAKDEAEKAGLTW